MANATYTKLRSGEWGIRATIPVIPGTRIDVITKVGKIKTETVANVVWSGNGVWIAAVQSEKGRQEHGFPSGVSKFCRSPQECADALAWDAPDRLCHSCERLYDN